MKVAAGHRYGVAAVDRAAAVLDAFDGASAATLAELARRTGLTEATALRYLSSLARHDLVERDATSGRYRLGLRLFQLGQRALRDRDPRAIALPHMERLRDRYEETVNLAIRNGDALVLVEVLEGRRSIKKVADVGDHDVWHSSGLGKSILSCLPEEEARAVLERHGYPRYTAATRTSFEELAADLELVRRLGYAVDHEESEEGLCCVAAPIFDKSGEPAYAISVSGPASRITRDIVQELGREMSAAAASISAALGHFAALEQGGDGARPA